MKRRLNALDYQLKSLEDKLYLVTKDMLLTKEDIDSKHHTKESLKEKLLSIQTNIKGTENILNGTLSEEEEKVLSDYYQALNTKNELTNELNNLKNNLESLNSNLDELTYLSKKDNSLYNEKNNELKDLEIEINRNDVKLDNLLNQLNETYSMTFEYAKEHYKLDMDVTLVKNKISSLKRQMRELEPINATAPEEYARVSENTLLEIIEEMDDVMETSFMKTFNIINQNFEITFKELFKGGTAKLTLTNPDNILETGIEIVASPPGKSLKSISALSGGEKTFTAISLLFAILKSRPVPFCVLDEVEAALDEVNVESFGEYIQKLKGKTQFIIITHKKKTMEFADILYGITMQESGVSKLVSVRLEDLKDDKK